MNQHASDAPQNDREGSPRAPLDNDRDVGGGAGETAQDQPITATLVHTDDPTVVRTGSPFAIDPVAALPAKPIEVFHDVGPIRYTALGAVAASVMVLAFAGTAAWWFPVGGTLTAALGCVLSIFGMYSSYRKTSAGLLAIHLCLFVASYGRSLG